MDKGADDCNKQIIRKYERYLSPFGRKVWSTLVNIKNDFILERKNANFKQIMHVTPYSRHQNKRVLRFSDFNTSRTSPINNFSNENNDEVTNEIDFQYKNTSLPQVSTSNDLVKAACNDDIGNVTENIDRNISSRNNSIPFCQEYSLNKEISRNETSPMISWSDMFDNEIFEHLEDENNDNSKQNSKKVDDNECSTDKNNDNVNDKKRKCSIDTPKNIKKAKTNVSNKNNEKKRFYKKKYTTTVKNWLNDIDTENVLGEESTDNQQNIETANANKRSFFEQQKISKREINKTVLKEKRIKKTVQAQLANKDGIMKYKKPKNFVGDELNSENNVGTSADSLVKISKILKESNIKLKENKVKTNFVAPIKSQTPVKEITYEVIIINSLNYSTFMVDVEKMEADEGVMILVYCNGFCQLNSQHADDSCIPEGIMICFKDTFYYLEEHGITDFLCRVLATNTFITFDAKRIFVYLLSQYNITPNNCNIIDTKIGASLINPDEPPEDFSELQKLLEFSPGFTIATDSVLQKAAWYMTLLKECSEKLKGLLVEQGLWKVFTDIEMRILPIVAGMEHRGISVDVTKLKSMEDILLSRLKTIEVECHKAAGKVFQVNSTAQVRTIIYDELKLDAASNIKIRETICKGAKSTSEAMLRSLIGVHPLPKLILEYRHLHKAHATFLAGIVLHVRDGVVKPTWDQSAAATGRIASNNPNLQAIPKMPFNLVLFPKDEVSSSDTPSLSFRSVYVPRAGHTLLAADFKHIECRVFAHAAADAELLSALESPDLFRVLAAKWLGKPCSAVSGADRERTKRVVYASLYGAGARKLAEILAVPYDQALTIATSFNRTFPSLKSFGRSVVSECARRGGRLSTAGGRGRTFADISNTDFAARSHAERQAVNFIIQGTAADLCKVAMALTAEGLRAAAPPLAASLLLQIHDELVWEVPDEHLDRAAVIIKKAMESSGHALGMTQALPVAMYRGASWGELEEFHPNIVQH